MFSLQPGRVAVPSQTGSAKHASTSAAADDGTVSLYDYIRFQHFDAVDEARKFQAAWEGLRGLVDDDRYDGVKARFAQQVRDGTVMCTTLMDYYRALYLQ